MAVIDPGAIVNTDSGDHALIQDVREQFANVGEIVASIQEGEVDVTSDGSSTPRPLSERFAEWTNVKDFGAVGDGVTDDTGAIASAFTYADTYGKTVYFPVSSGPYMVSSIEVYTDVYAVGAVIQALPNSGDIVTFMRSGLTWYGGTIDCDKATQTTAPGHGMYAASKVQTRIEYVTLVDPAYCGIILYDCSGSTVSHCKVYESELTGIQLFCSTADLEDVTVEYCTVERIDDASYPDGCVKYSNNSGGSYVMRNCSIGPNNILTMSPDANGVNSVNAEIWADTDSGGWGCSIHNNFIDGGAFQASLSRVDASIISKNRLRNTNSIGAEVAHGKYCMILDNGVDVVNQTGITGVSVSNSGSTGNTIRNNVMMTSGTGSYLRGVYVGDRATDTLIDNNRVPANASSGVLLNGAVRAQVIYNTLGGSGNEGVALFSGCQYVDVGYNQFTGTWLNCVRVVGNNASYTTNVISIHHNNMIGATPNHYLIDGSYLGTDFQIYDNQNVPWGREVFVVDPAVSPSPSFVAVAVASANNYLLAWGSNGGMPYFSTNSGGLGLRPNGVDTVRITSTSGDAVLESRGSASSSLRLADTGAGTNLKTYDLVSTDGSFFITSRNDDGTGKYRAIGVDASGNTSIGGPVGTESFYVPQLNTSTAGIAISPSSSSLPGIIALGAATNIGVTIRSKGTQAVYLMTNTANTQVRVLHVASADRTLDLQGGAGVAPIIKASTGSLGIASPLELTNQTVSTTAPSAGGAGALPATPAGYVTILVNGTSRVMPYY